MIRIALLVLSLVLTSCAQRVSCCACPARLSATEGGEVQVRVQSGDDPRESPHYDIAARFVRTQAGAGASRALPRVAVRPGTTASLDVAESTSFVQDFDIEVSGDDFIADPIIGIIQEGLSLEIVAAPDPTAEDTAWVAFRVMASDLARPIRTRRVRWARSGRQGTVQLPRITVADETGIRRAKHGTEIMLASVPAPDGEGHIQVYARITAVGNVRSVALETPTTEKRATDAEESGMLRLGVEDRPLAALVGDAVAGKAGTHSIHIDVITTPVELPPLRAIEPARAKQVLRGTGRKLRSFELTSASMAGVQARTQRQFSYVQDYDARGPLTKRETQHGVIEASKLGIYDPVIGVIQSGISAGLAEIDGRLHLEVIWAKPAGAPDFQVELAPGFTVSIELPELRLMHARIDMTSGRASVALGGADAPEDPIDLRSGRVLVPLLKYVHREGGRDAVGTIALWIELRKRDA